MVGDRRISDRILTLSTVADRRISDRGGAGGASNKSNIRSGPIGYPTVGGAGGRYHHGFDARAFRYELLRMASGRENPLSKYSGVRSASIDAVQLTFQVPLHLGVERSASGLLTRQTITTRGSYSKAPVRFHVFFKWSPYQIRFILKNIKYKKRINTFKNYIWF